MTVENKMKNELMVTVIVPVYNVKPYINKCIESILAQTYNNIQIILVDDGSTDGSGLICDKYIEKDSRIEVIHKKNGGVSSARNAALDYVRGDFLAFIDADDFIAPMMFESLLNVMIENDADAGFCAYSKIRDSNNEVEEEKFLCTDEVLSVEEAIEKACLGGYHLTLWNKMFRVASIKGEEGISEFPVDLSIGEDMYWLIINLMKCDRIVCIPYVGYNYRIAREGSAVFNGKGNSWYRACSSRKEASLRTYKILENNHTKIAWFFYKRYVFSIKDIMCMAYLDKQIELSLKARDELKIELSKYSHIHSSVKEVGFILKCRMLAFLIKIGARDKIISKVMQI